MCIDLGNRSFINVLNMSDITVFAFVFLGLIPGVLCDNYTVAGLVAVTVVGGLLLIIIIVMIVFGVIWNDWFPKFQEVNGRIKMPKIKKKHDSQESILGSEMKHYPPSLGAPSHGVSLPPSRQNTQGRGSKAAQQNILHSSAYASEKADTWIQEVEPAPYDEITKEMAIEDEEPEIIVTELLPAHNGSAHIGSTAYTFPQNTNAGSAHIGSTAYTFPQNTNAVHGTNVTTGHDSGGIDVTVTKQPLQRLSTLSSNKDAVLDLSDEDDDLAANHNLGTKTEGEATMMRGFAIEGVWVEGMQHYGPNKLEVNSVYSLQREENNLNDRNAIKVLDQPLKVTRAYVSRQSAAALAQIMDKSLAVGDNYYLKPKSEPEVRQKELRQICNVGFRVPANCVDIIKKLLVENGIKSFRLL